MRNYIELVNDILKNANLRSPEQERTGTGTLSVFSRELRFDLSDNKVPMVTTTRISFDLIVKELLFFIAGNTNIKSLTEQNCHIWDEWAVSEASKDKLADIYAKNGLIQNEETSLVFFKSVVDPELMGEIGPMYGYNWRFWPRAAGPSSADIGINPLEYNGWDISEFGLDMPRFKKFYEESTGVTPEYNLEEFNNYCYRFFFSYVDQLMILIHNLKKNPYSRRHLVTAFNPALSPIPGIDPDVQPLLDRGSLDPCHYAFQCYVKPPADEGGKMRLSMKFNMR